MKILLSLISTPNLPTLQVNNVGDIVGHPTYVKLVGFVREPEFFKKVLSFNEFIQDPKRAKGLFPIILQKPFGEKSTLTKMPIIEVVDLENLN